MPASSEVNLSELVLTPGRTTLADLENVWRNGLAVRLAEVARAGIAASAARIDAAARGDKPVYGVNTGFGKLASIKIRPEDTATLQRNLILSHCCGVGEPVEPETVRLILALKLLSLGRGASGVRPVSTAKHGRASRTTARSCAKNKSFGASTAFKKGSFAGCSSGRSGGQG